MPHIVTERALNTVVHQLKSGQRFCENFLTFIGICGAVLCVLMPVESAFAERLSPGDIDAPANIARAVLDIISYAHWPVQPEVYRLCVAGGTAYLRDMSVQANVVAGRPVQMRDLEMRGEPSLSSCDVVYIGALPGEARKNLLTGSQRLQILTIEEQGEDCTDGAMFSLRALGNRFSLKVNLDAISRSGIRISPNVLLLGRRKPVQP
ncbi:YfiR family protein [Paraburkholderia ginsengisoli]|uniref:YfiR family protein n=1 Tax=Paraburkholderia ginsengisoli TaxID=311231 RepID=A0A7T4N8P2_9BURK|nr:YfiR family protein [Paraburkholderia ginsengisoli]QQC67299.1 YfiR family protein [Paraburkholderia ginsengisoli]